MSLRTRLIVSALLLLSVSLSGAYIIMHDLNTLLRNQEMFTFKNKVFHSHHIALAQIQSAQSNLYRHKAGYSRNIDILVNDISGLRTFLRNIADVYLANVRPHYCSSCHSDVSANVSELSDRMDGLALQLEEYMEHVSVFITTNDPESQAFHNERAAAIGEEIAAAITEANRKAGLMVDALIKSNEALASETMITITGAMATIVFISLTIMAYTLYTLHRMMSSLLHGTESISRDDFSLRIPAGEREDEYGVLAGRFNLMADHLQDRDREIREKTRQLEEANRQLRDLNENLEGRILGRTSELEDMVSQLRKTTSALEDSKRRLEATNVDLLKANQAKANFLSIVSHELKTPLSVINGFLSLILDERYQNDPKNLREAIEISKRRGQQLARMIDELIDLSRLDARAMVIHKMPVSVGEAIEDATEQFREDTQRKQIRIKVLDCSTLPPVRCDPDKFKQIITNLISNAVKFSPEGSVIELGCREKGEEYLFHCRDQGIGIPFEEHEKIFEKFYQVDSSATRRYGGAGLGLSIVKEIVHLHGGRIWVESEEGRGCTFTFTIPRNGKEEHRPHLPGKRAS